MVVAYNPLTVSESREKDVPVVYGDAGSAAVLDHARLEEASLLAALVHDDVAAEMAVRHARAFNPGRDTVLALAVVSLFRSSARPARRTSSSRSSGPAWRSSSRSFKYTRYTATSWGSGG